MRRPTHKYTNLDDLNSDRDSVAWYWRLIALTASWMILGGYLILPSAYDSDPHLRFSKGVLTIIVVTLMTTGYSFTGLLCFACHSWAFQAEAVFLPALSASALGLLTVLWCFASSSRFVWNSAAIVATVLSGVSSIIYGLLLLWTHRKITNLRASTRSLSTYSETSFYKNFIANMYPSVRKNPDAIPLTDEERINQQMAMLLMKSDPGPSPDAGQNTFKINLPDEPEHEMYSEIPYRPPNTAAPNQGLASPRGQRNSTVQEYYNSARGRSESGSGSGSGSGNGGLPEPQRSAWDRNSTRGRAGSELTVEDAAYRGRSVGRESGERSRAVSREERRREIELGTLPGGSRDSI